MLGPLLFVSFVVLMALVLLNMFLAIIVQTYRSEEPLLYHEARA